MKNYCCLLQFAFNIKVKFQPKISPQNMSNDELSFNCLKSPPVVCPSPIIIFQKQSSNAQSVAFVSPQPMETPAIAPKDESKEIQDAILQIHQMEQNITNRMKSFEEVVNKTLQSKQPAIPSKPTFVHNDERSSVCHLPQQSLKQLGMSVQECSLSESLPPVGNLQMRRNNMSMASESSSGMFNSRPERDSMLMSQQDIERLVDKCIDNQMDDFGRSIQATMKMESTLQRLECSLQKMIQTQFQSVTIK